MTPLTEDLLLITLSPAEPRNTRVHPGIRAAICGAGLLEGWLEGASLGSYKDVRRHVRTHTYDSLEPALAPLVAAGRVTTASGGGSKVAAVLTAGATTHTQTETLVDVAAADTVRARLSAALAGSGAPAARDAALAVTLYCGRLWNWSALEPHSVEEVRVFGRRREPVGPLKARAAALSTGELAPASGDGEALVMVAKALNREYRDYSD